MLALCLYQFGYKANLAKAIYPSMATLDSAYNISGGALNSSSAKANDPGITVYGGWDPVPSGLTFASGGIYVDGAYVQDYYPGWFSTPLQFGVSVAAPITDGTHTVQLRAVSNPYYNGSCDCYSTDEYRSNSLTFYVQHVAAVTCTVSLSGSLNSGYYPLSNVSYSIFGSNPSAPNMSGAYNGNSTLVTYYDSVPAGSESTYNLSMPPTISGQVNGNWQADLRASTSSGLCNSSTTTVPLNMQYSTPPSLDLR